MELTINGEVIKLPTNVLTVADLLTHFQLNEKIAMVEVNLSIIERSHFAETKLSNGDKVEIVHFVGGG
ncbi:sulfur carrier protein ThiS [Bacillus kexueae]|uniref:sulfur carrier protein ThiS n=1 Tax=Aeribacillus kexueae TaxID=2078952 RepID=UPI001FAE9E17|nr:sulfur carrier protein ThiS [Bacillus kexueae]